MHRETKSTKISGETKQIVWDRDAGRCVLCGSVSAGPHCHYVRRSHGGMGIEQNIWTGCNICHEKFDSESSDGELHSIIKSYLKSWYENWDESQLIYKKYGGICIVE